MFKYYFFRSSKNSFNYHFEWGGKKKIWEKIKKKKTEKKGKKKEKKKRKNRTWREAAIKG